MNLFKRKSKAVNTPGNKITKRRFDSMKVLSKPHYRISLSADDFESLIRGKIIEFDFEQQGKVEILLQDIGYDLMADLLQKAYRDYINKRNLGA